MKLKSKTEEMAEVSYYNAIAQFFNMSIIPLIVSGVEKLDVVWYQTVGLTMLMNLTL